MECSFEQMVPGMRDPRSRPCEERLEALTLRAIGRHCELSAEPTVRLEILIE